ncbi:hypothetical protein [Kitasatospora kifunensis]|uniref:Uncharacterized protein n=1 Tax=Kitasatospora kifunensis TaxID=58351 RepID=A0A7W7QY46_KITKI|nr:hypothetical protein [Kitasatospora kifunensis]MBB4921933.1 hypothetical protein [Kitasatospora kifunensis]
MKPATFAPTAPTPATGSTTTTPTAATPGTTTAAAAPSTIWTTNSTAPQSTSDATRYLCAAVQLDDALAKKAIESVLEEPHRAVASSPGIDLACVLRYALAARSRQITAQALLVLTAVVLVAVLFFQPVLAIPLLVVAWAIILVERLVLFYGVLKPELSRASFDPARAPRATSPTNEALLQQLAAQDHLGNVSVFPGYQPFIGYGNLLDSWNFVIPVDRPADPFDDVLPFRLEELSEATSRAVQALGLPGVDISERVFISGADLAQHLSPDLRLLLLPQPTGRPKLNLPPSELKQLRDDRSNRARSYLVTTVSGWEQELVTTSTIRYSLSSAKDLLFIEGASLVLPPIHHRYHQVDYLLDRPTWRQLLVLMRKSATELPGKLVAVAAMVIASPVALLVWALTSKERAQQRQIAQHTFNYGAQLCLREAAGDPKFHRYFQQIDRQMHTKIVERRVMDTMVDFLEAHRIDVSELKERQNVIYNGGVFASGNASVRFVNSAVAAGMGSRIRSAFGRGPANERKEG